MEEISEQQEFLVTARKWRPLSFSSVVGQQHITTTLQNAVKSGRIHHAYLFSGPRGVGKTTTARILARAINCTNPQADNEPCNECVSCKSIIEGRALDVIEIDGASNNSVDDIRGLRENSRYLPTSGKYKIYIIDEVHMLSTSAFNALLKTLEEPPAHLLFIFATTEPHKVLPTILSRCQRFEFKRMEIDDIVYQLKEIASKENIEIDEKSLVTIAKKGDGSMRDSQSIFDQVIAFCGDNVDYSKMSDALHLIDIDFYFRITDDIKTKNLSDIFILTKQILDKGYDLKETMEGLVEHIRNILTIKVTDTAGLVETSKEGIMQYKRTAEQFSQNDLLRLLVIASNAESQLKYAAQPRIKFETSLLQMAAIDSTAQISELIGEIRDLKKNSNSAVTAKNISATANNPVIKDTVSAYKAYDTTADKSKTAAKAENGSFKGEINSGWDSFKNKYANSQYNMSALMYLDNKCIKFENSFITIYTGSFLAQKLEKEKSKLKQYLREFYGEPIDVIIIVGEPSEGNCFTGKDFEEFREYSITGSSKVDSYTERKINSEPESEIEKKIVKLFNAQLIN